MLGKMLLPRVGGTPAGWIAAVAFFQVMLLLGYLLAHGLARLSPRLHGAGYIAALLAGTVFLPATLPQHIAGTDMHAGGIFMLLLGAIGLPFVALSASAATLQRLFLTTSHDRAGDPYFLYAASNLGSFAGLLLYPLLIEPASTLDTQTAGWAYAYYILIACAMACLILGGKAGSPAAAAPAIERSSLRDMARWTYLAFIPSALLLAVTTHIVTDIVSAPLVWVLPLALYLLTFVLAFAQRQWIPPRLVSKITPAVIAFTLAHALMLDTRLSDSFLSLLMHLLAFGIIALMCHQRLAALRPAPAQLTAFYLMIAVGGALGGLLNAFIAPMVLNTLAEYPVLLVAACFAHPSFEAVFKGAKAHIMLYVLLLAAAVMLYLLRETAMTWIVGVTLTAALAGFAALYPRAMIVMTLLLGVVGKHYYNKYQDIYSERNFFGVLRVTERDVTGEDGNIYRFRDFSHGTTLHGYQIISPESYRQMPTAYFHAQSPIAEILNNFQPRDIAVVGLGAGTLACHRAPDRHYTFYEVDPAVIRIAQEHFSFLKDCTGAQPHRLVEGDGRLALAAEDTAFYDLIILDAFSSDTIPPHLMTVEAIKMYMQRLNIGGLIVFNISSRYFDIAPVLASAGDAAGLYSLHKEDIFDTTPPLEAQPSHWVVMGRDAAKLSQFGAAHDWFAPRRHADMPAWYDNYSNILGVIRK
jgi:spermidine synthase